MAQFVRPSSDIDNTGGWTTSPLWSKINGVVGSDDSDFVSSDSNPISSESFTVDGTTATDPVSSSGHVLRLRAAKDAGGSNNDITTELRQGYISEASQGTLIATLTLLVTSATPATATHNLTTGEADTITDYSDLQFRSYAAKNGGGAGRAGRVIDVELEVPDASVAYTLTCDSGSYTATGQTIGLQSDRTMPATAGSYTTTGQALEFAIGYNLPATAGSYTTTGQALGFATGYNLTATAGTYTTTGQTIVLQSDRTMPATAGSYTTTGQALGFAIGYNLPITAGSYTTTGQTIGLQSDRVIPTTAGSYTTTGQAITLTYTPAAGYDLTATAGNYTTTGQTLGFAIGYNLPTTAGNYTTTGQALGFAIGYNLTATAGSYTATGQTIVLQSDRTMPATAGSYAITGQVLQIGDVPLYESITLTTLITETYSAIIPTTISIAFDNIVTEVYSSNTAPTTQKTHNTQATISIPYVVKII